MSDKIRTAICPACNNEVEFKNGMHQCQELKEFPYCGGFAYILEDVDPDIASAFHLKELSGLISCLSGDKE
jgi:hypothetical protein